MSYDRSSDGSLMRWLSETINARSATEKHALQSSSGDFPRFDRVLAAALCKPEHLRSHFGVRFNSYLEECELNGHEVRGRVMLNLVYREFDTDQNAGAIMTALELYNLPPPQDNVASLRQWRDKVNYVRNQIGPADRPEPRLLAKWLYDRVKKHPLMRRHVDKVRDAPPGSECLTFDWLWGKLEQCLHESQQEANALSIQEALRKGPSKKPHSVQESSGLPASKGGKDGKGKGKPGKGDKDGKGKSKQTSKPTTAKTPELTATQKAEMPCIYFAQGKCFREKCPFKHDPNAKSKPAPKTTNPKPKPSPTRPGMVALLAASITAALFRLHLTTIFWNLLAIQVLGNGWEVPRLCVVKACRLRNWPHGRELLAIPCGSRLGGAPNLLLHQLGFGRRNLIGSTTFICWMIVPWCFP